ncbi:MAG: YdeI/OmpD-associated family protein [Balneolaceae bacterium]|nr:YdeI/OmpD-associated family protein [Balneolaceae bacterium]
MIKTENFDKVEISSQEELRSWLMNNHLQSESVWLVTYKKSEPDKYVSRWEVLDELICFGWIDGIRRKLDDKRTMQLISQRKVEHWARTYKERAAKLIDQGKMHQSGLKTIEDSKSNGLWTFMDDVDNLIIPKDLSEELSKLDGAADFFQSINDSSKRFVLRWIKLAKTDKTRQNRIKKITELSSKGEKLPGS